MRALPESADNDPQPHEPALVPLTAQRVQTLFPFHVVVDAQRRITQLGASLAKCLPDMQAGQTIDDYLQPADLGGVPWNEVDLLNDRQCLMLQCQAADNDILHFRGSVEPLSAGGAVLLLGAPLAHQHATISNYRLKIKDFAPFDSSLEHYATQQMLSTQLRDSERMISVLRGNAKEQEKRWRTEYALAKELNLVFDVRLRLTKSMQVTDIHAPGIPQFSVQDLIGQHVSKGLPFIYDPLSEAQSKMRDGQTSIAFEFTYQNGRIARYFDARLAVSPEGTLLVFAHDVTDKRRVAQQLEYRAHHDFLTGVFNRRRFSERAEEVLCATSDDSRYAALLLIDLDNFKDINDSYGHAAGDLALSDMAKTLRRNMRNEDVIGRLGGDEFAVIMRDISHRQAEKTCERLQSEFARELEHNGSFFSISASIGLSFSDDVETYTEWLQQADLAMYEAKTRGKGKMLVYQAGMRAAHLERLEIRNKLSLAIDHNQFSLDYQPIVCIDTGKVVGFELLARWREAGKVVATPDVFVAVAEENGLILPLGECLLLKALEQIARWCRQFPVASEMFYAVNLSVYQLYDDALIPFLTQQLAKWDIPTSLIHLEITETALINDVETASAKIQQLRSMGFTLTLDDFGTGYSSLSYLDKLSIDKLKIDRSFIMGIKDNVHSAPLVEAIIRLAELMGMAVVAEGVETPHQQNLLRTFRCEQGQGFGFSKPLQNDQLIALFEQGDTPPMLRIEGA